MRKVPYPAPGEILLEEFLKPMGITQYRLAKEIGVPQRRIGEIVAGTRAITPDTGLRLSRFFAMSDGFWTGLQGDYDREKARAALAKTLARIKPWPEAVRARRSA
jgi:addiction module HigA family antidote